MQKRCHILFDLRPEVVICRRNADTTGNSEWVIHDPLQQRYFQINEETRSVLANWKSGLSFEAVIDAVGNSSGYKVTEEEISALQDFLQKSNLAFEPDSEKISETRRNLDAGSKSFLQKLLGGVFFYKFSVWRPSAFLATSYPYVSWVSNRTTLTLIGLMGITGLYLASSNPVDLREAFANSLSLESSLFFIIALIFVKCMHELGHAYAATRYGCKVPDMGVALMAMFPVLYTDVSDTWRLSKTQRMKVSGAGVFVELIVASIATFCWNFMENGTPREVVFVVASASWISSLLINLNPMMKFDGYYLLSDFLKIENMQSRAFHFGKWQIRRLLFAKDLPPPEQVSNSVKWFLTLYAFATWAYRLMIFTAIVLLIYHFVFKFLGVFLFFFGMWQLILAPVYKEIRSWREINTEYYSRKRLVYSAAAGFVVVALAFLPLSATVRIPAILQASDLTRIYPPATSILVSTEVGLGEFVKAGEPLFRMAEPELEASIKTAEAQAAEVRTKLARVIASSQDRNEMMILRRQLDSITTQIHGLRERRNELVITAPINGRVVQLAENLHRDRWVQKGSMLAIMTSSESWTARGYAGQLDIERLSAGATGKFIPDDLSRSSIKVQLTELPVAAATFIDIPELAKRYGGKISVHEDDEGRLGPVSTLYPISLSPSHFPGNLNQSIRGVVLLSASGQSLAGKIWRSAKRVLLRESTF